MGLFSFLFDPQDKVTVQFEMPRKQYESLQFLIDSAKTIRPDYDHSTLLCNLVEVFIKRNLGTVTKKNYV